MCEPTHLTSKMLERKYGLYVHPAGILPVEPHPNLKPFYEKPKFSWVFCHLHTNNSHWSSRCSVEDTNEIQSAYQQELRLPEGEGDLSTVLCLVDVFHCQTALTGRLGTTKWPHSPYICMRLEQAAASGMLSLRPPVRVLGKQPLSQ